jgi:putative ABC transport system permease protein
MLRLKNISKTYQVGDFRQRALDGVSVAFRKKEFVMVLGPSGCGKTTLLNIIGGLDHYDEGDLEILGKSTKNFQDREWDMYRNNSIGFIFQSHNLIPHLSILQNVEMGLALSGIPAAERHRRAKDVLIKVGLAEHIHKRPNQLSGGQSQRVAIARALATDPDIILADEPTGSLDSVTSIQILDLIREIAREKLVIMVTHNAELAAKYATRIIRLKDGRIVDDTNPVQEEQELHSTFALKKTAMSFGTALVSSWNNIKTKLGRTLLTAFAGSIGIIGIALILALSTGMDKQIDDFEQNAIAEYPIEIVKNNIDFMRMRSMMTDQVELPAYPEDKSAYVYASSHLADIIKENRITAQYETWVQEYANGAGRDLITGLRIDRYIDMSLLLPQGENVYVPVYQEKKDDGPVNPGVGINLAFFNRLPQGPILANTYDILEGSFPVADPEEGTFEVVLVVDEYNRIYDQVLMKLGYPMLNEGETVAFADLIGKKFKLYVGTYVPGVSDVTTALDITVSGIVRLKEGATSGLFYNGLGFPGDVFDYLYETYPDSVGTEIKSITIYARDFDAKEAVKAHLDFYNDFYQYPDGNVNRIEYRDNAQLITSMAKNVLDTISIVLIAFSAVSLVVSSIMIAIITYISVLERIKEIGVLRALGARKKDVSRVFNSENLLIGFAAGLVGIGTAYLLTIPANLIIEHFADVPNVARLRLSDALILVLVSTLLAFIAGFIPARMASKKDPVIALRTE